MQANFEKIKKENPLLAKEKEFYDNLFCYAGQETNETFLVFIIDVAFQYATGDCHISLSQHIGAMVDDAETVKKAKRILGERAAKLIKSLSKEGRESLKATLRSKRKHTQKEE